MTGLLAAFLLPALLGVAAVNAVSPAPLGFGRAGDWTLKGLLGIGAGVAIASALYFLLLLVAGPGAFALLLCEGVLVAGLLLVTRRRQSHANVFVPDATPLRWLTWLLALAFVLAACRSVAEFYAVTAAQPHGDWDAWAVWNLRARFLLTPQWRDAFTPALGWSQIDYPLLLPAWIAHAWRVAGTQTLLAPALTAAMFTFATLALLVSSVAMLRSRSHGLIAGLLLLGCVGFLHAGTMQYADVPFSFYFLATLVVLALEDRSDRPRPDLLLLAGAFVGMAAWTKNEGQALLLAVTLSLVGAKLLARGSAAAVKTAGWLIAGALPFLLLAFVVRSVLADGTTWVPGPRAILHSQWLLSPARYQVVAAAMWAESGRIGGSLGRLIPWLLLAYAAVVGPRVERGKLFLWVGLATLALMIGAVALVYGTSPFDLDWQLRTSLSRLACQWLPSILFLYFLLLDTPERLVAGRLHQEADESFGAIAKRQ